VVGASCGSIAAMRITLPSGTPAEQVRYGNPAAGLVVVPDIFGLRPLFDEMCERIAIEQGLSVVAVEPFPGRDLGGDVEVRQREAATLRDDDLLRDLAQGADATGCEKVGVIGFCMGGMYTLKAAGTGRFAAAVSFYGMIRVPARWQSPGQGEPLDYVARPEACPVLAIIGVRDPYTPPEDVDALAALPNVTVASYPEADHGFVHDPSRPAHRPDDAADAWRRCFAFLAQHLGTAPTS
jgi:carboxymethylenebutenolidase